MALQKSNLSASHDSPYAAELQDRVAGRRFNEHLEKKYAGARLREYRVLIRVTCVLSALVSLFSLVRHFFNGHLSHEHLQLIVVVVLASIVLAAIACSSLFERFYLPLAKVVVPVRNALAAALIARVAAHGQMETLMILPLMVIGPFFLLGLPPRVALISVVVTIISFVVSATAMTPVLSAMVFACTFMVAIAVACAVASRYIDEGSRKRFLESQLIAEFAEHDALTGTKNRRMFDEHLERLWQQAIEDGRSIAVLLIDVDYFKKYNDHYGHQAGDRALRRVAETLQKFVNRPLDVLARYGGEEFAVVLKDAKYRQAAHIAEQMRHAVADLAIEQRDGISGRVTISIGAAVLEPTAERGPRGALQLADQALYEAKVRGRNRVELKVDEDYTLLVTGVFSKSAFPGPREAVEAGPVPARVAQA
jgi:diguanylate cyclase (GGDEF)-like protein